MCRKRPCHCTTSNPDELAPSQLSPPTVWYRSGSHQQIGSGQIKGRECPLWVISGHRGISNQCPLYPQKRTSPTAAWTSVKCQKRQVSPAPAAPLASRPRSLFLLLFSEHFHCRNGSTTSQSKFFFLPSLSSIAKAAPFVELDRIRIVGSHLHDYFSVWVQQLLYFTPNCTADAKTLIFW